MSFCLAAGWTDDTQLWKQRGGEPAVDGWSSGPYGAYTTGRRSRQPRPAELLLAVDLVVVLAVARRCHPTAWPRQPGSAFARAGHLSHTQ